MGYDCKILADSIGPNWVRLTTFEVTFPRIVLAEFNTHRMLSRNSASSRAIPVEKQIDRVRTDPFIPVSWGKNGRGMQAKEELGGQDAFDAEMAWKDARDAAINNARFLLELGVHKQITNRLLEPFQWHTVIVTATEWENFFNLRCHPGAQPEIQVIAKMMRRAYQENTPQRLEPGQWHLPLVPLAEWTKFDIDILLKLSVGRCARISYLTHDGRRDPEADIALHDRLRAAGHMSPFEHQAQCLPAYTTASTRHTSQRFFGNFRGWLQHRKTLPGEAVFQRKENENE